MPFNPHAGRYAYRCTFCDIGFENREELDEHEKDVHFLDTR